MSADVLILLRMRDYVVRSIHQMLEFFYAEVGDVYQMSDLPHVIPFLLNNTACLYYYPFLISLPVS